MHSLIIEEAAEPVALTINKEFAQRLHYNKQREELHRLEERYGRKEVAAKQEGQDSLEEESSSSSSEDEEEDILEELQDPEFLHALAQLRNRQASAVLPAAEGEQKDEKGKKRKREKPVLLKDIQHDLGEDDDQEIVASTMPSGSEPFSQQLEGFREQFIKAADSTMQDGLPEDLFGQALPQDRQHGSASAPQATSHEGMHKMLDDYFGKDEDLAQADLFLKRYIASRGEAAVDSSLQPSGDLGGNDLEEDEEHLKAADQFEAQHNFRFEEPDCSKVKTYPRQLEGVIREADTRRARARASRKQRKQEERDKMEAGIQRLKTLKRQEIESRLREVQTSSGLPVISKKLQDILQSDDFNEEEYDKAMESLFDDGYYENEDAEFKGQQIEEEEEGPHSEADEAAEGPNTGFKALKHQVAAQTLGIDAKRDAKSVQKLLQEYNKLEYEDIIAGMPTKFHYRAVLKEDYGLSTSDILSLADKDLNQLVGLKKYAPYKAETSQKRLRRDTLHKLSNFKKSSAQAFTPAESGNKAEATDAAPEKRRKATYAKPQLNEGKSRVIKQSSPTRIELDALPEMPAGLTKAQRKNIKRSLKRKLNKAE